MSYVCFAFFEFPMLFMILYCGTMDVHSRRPGYRALGFWLYMGFKT
jgi:hypothetical protein